MKILIDSFAPTPWVNYYLCGWAWDNRPQTILMHSQGWETQIHRDLFFMCILLLEVLTGSSHMSFKWDSCTWNFQITCVLFPILHKNEGFHEMIMGPLVCWGNQLQFSSSLMPIKMNNACSKILVIKGKNIEYKLNDLNQWIILQTAILKNWKKVLFKA